MPHSIFAGEVMAHERLIHQDQRGAARYFALVPNAATDERNSQGGEILGANEFHVSFLCLRRRLAENLNGKRKAAVGRCGVAGDSGGKDPWGCRDLVPKVSEVLGAISPGCVRVLTNGNHYGHGVLRFIAE